MPKDLENSGADAEQKTNEKQDFSLEVDIKGLAYVFEGKVPNRPDDFEWSVSVPNAKEQTVRIDEMIKAGELDGVAIRWLKSGGLGDGKVGLIDVVDVEPEDEIPSIGLALIKTNTDYLPQEFGYNGAEGVGSFLLDNLCALADIKGWRIYLESIDGGGKLMQDDLYYWYQRKGFKDGAQLTRHSHHEFGGMQRQPTEPDGSRAIASVVAE